SQAVAADPGFARVELLRRIGLVEEAIGELEELAERATGDPVRLYGISGAYVKEERYHLALRILRRALAPLAATGDPALPREFGDPRVAIAAYNAGPKRARQWWSKRRTDDLEAWVELIPYDETRYFVKRVVLSWNEYRRIYGGQ